MELGVIGVEQFNQMVKLYIETQPMLANLLITGEISELKYYASSGHLYFTLKERESSVSCAAFRYLYKPIARDLKVGDKVEIVASANYFEKTGRFQLTVDKVTKQKDLGSRFLELERVKRRLHSEGYFDEARKKLLPKLPQTIGIITSEYGAALQDFLHTAKMRAPKLDIRLFAVHVQGDEVENDVVKALEYFYKNPVDVIVITRGGGSIEDLWGFNSEKIVLKMAESHIPIVSAIGHEVDTVLIDLAADIRAATPTQAAEIIVPEWVSLKSELQFLRQRLKGGVENRVLVEKERLKHLENNYFIKNIKEVLLFRERDRLQEYKHLLKRVLEDKMVLVKAEIEKNHHILRALSIESTLKRGYSVTTHQGRVIRDPNGLIGDEIETLGYGYKIISKVIREEV